MNLLFVLVIAMAVTMALVPLTLKVAGHRFDDQPGGRKVHSGAVPRVGGIAIAVGVIVSLALWLPRTDHSLLSYCIGALVIFGFGVWDDAVNLPPSIKFAGQFIAIACVVWFGHVSIDAYTLAERHTLTPWIGIPLTVLFILGTTNAINLSDGLDGLAGGTTLLTISALGLLAMTYGQMGVATVAMAVCGAILGFLRFNTHPARVFMGDGGSQFLGYTVAVLAVMLTQMPTVPISTALPLLLLGVPAVDTAMVMIQRWKEGSPMFVGDQRHIHHKLLSLGFDHGEAVLAIYAGQALFFVAAWFMRYEPDFWIVVVFLALAGLIVALLLAAGRFGWRWRRWHPDATASWRISPMQRAILWLMMESRLLTWGTRTAAACVIGYGLGVVIFGTPPQQDLTWLAAGTALLLLLSIAVPFWRALAEWPERAALYVGGTMLVYLDHVTVELDPMLQVAKWICLPLLALCVAVGIRTMDQRRFSITTLDILLIFVAIVVPALPGLGGGQSNLGLSIVKLLTVFYGIELVEGRRLLSTRFVSHRILAIGLFFCLMIAVLRGFTGA